MLLKRAACGFCAKYTGNTHYFFKIFQFISQLQNVTKGDWIKGEALTIQQHVKAGRGVIKICSDLRIWLEKSHVCACFETCTAFAGLKLLPHHGIVQFCSEWWCHPIIFVIHFLFLNFDWVWCHYTSDTNNCIRTVFGACTLQKMLFPDKVTRRLNKHWKCHLRM